MMKIYFYFSNWKKDFFPKTSLSLFDSGNNKLIFHTMTMNVSYLN